MELLPNETINGGSISVTGLTKEELEEWKKTRLPLWVEEMRKKAGKRHIEPRESNDNSTDKD